MHLYWYQSKRADETGFTKQEIHVVNVIETILKRIICIDCEEGGNDGEVGTISDV
jgi:hypothetical protein